MPEQKNKENNSLNMKQSTKILLQEAYDHCEEQDKSLEYTFQYMQDVVNVNLDTVVEFFEALNRNN